MRASAKKNTTVYVAILANLVIAGAKFGAAVATQSSAMFSEGVHSLVDTVDGIFLIIGRKRSAKKPDQSHPFGYGLELYFWTLLVAIMVFALGGGLSIYKGILSLLHPVPIENRFWAYAVLIVAFVAEGSSFLFSLRYFRRHQKAKTFWKSVRISKDPTVFTVVFEDAVALIGIIVAIISLALGEWIETPYLDGAASILIGLFLGATSIIMARESKDLLAGESVRPEVSERIKKIILARAEISNLVEMNSLHLGPESILLSVKVVITRTLSASEFYHLRKSIKAEIQQEVNDLRYFYFESVDFEDSIDENPPGFDSGLINHKGSLD